MTVKEHCGNCEGDFMKSVLHDELWSARQSAARLRGCRTSAAQGVSRGLSSRRQSGHGHRRPDRRDGLAGQNACRRGRPRPEPPQRQNGQEPEQSSARTAERAPRPRSHPSTPTAQLGQADQPPPKEDRSGQKAEVDRSSQPDCIGATPLPGQGPRENRNPQPRDRPSQTD